jgi:hypothetical protein
MKMLLFILTFILIVSAIVGCTPSKTSVTAKTDDKGKQSGSVTQTFQWD